MLQQHLVTGEDEILTVIPLGAGSEVGRSCIILKYRGRTIMLDCGVHPAYTGLASLPFFDEVDPESIDLILISHFHLDHAAALPYYTQRTGYTGPVFMTHPTRAIFRWMLQDFVRVSSIHTDETLFTEPELEATVKRIAGVDYRQVHEHRGVKFTALNAGHVLGAAMFLIEIAGLRILYTGDYSREEDRHLMPAELPSGEVDVLITESTYGVQCHQPRLVRENRFTTLVKDILGRGGKCLIPVFALGRAQELLLILEEFWQSHPEMHPYPVYYVSGLARRCLAIYQTYVNAMNEGIKRQVSQGRNPFAFRFIRNLVNAEQLLHGKSSAPCVVFASPGMLQSGLSRDLFDAWAADRRNGLIIPGFVVEGTFGKEVLTTPREVLRQDGTMQALRMSVEYISFSAHVDFLGNASFMETLKPRHVILVHGEQTEMLRLRQAMQSRLPDTRFHTPRNCEPVNLRLGTKKTVKVLLSPGSDSGLLLRRDLEEAMLVDPRELPQYTPLSTFELRESLFVPCESGAALIEQLLVGLYGREAIVAESGTLSVMKTIQLKQHKAGFELTWLGDSASDLLADTIIGVLQASAHSRPAVKATLLQSRDPLLYLDVIKEYLEQRLGPVIQEEETCYRITLGGKSVRVSLEDLTVEACEEALVEDDSVDEDEEDLRMRVKGLIEQAITLIQAPPSCYHHH